MSEAELLREAIALLREYGTAYDDRFPAFPKYPPYSDRIREFLARVPETVLASDGVDPPLKGG